MNALKFNINDHVKVKLTDHGRRLHHEEYFPVAEWQMWDVMNRFGKHYYNGCEPPFETEIQIVLEKQ